MSTAPGIYPTPDGEDGIFNSIFFGANYNVSLINNTGFNWDIAEFAQEAPGIGDLPAPEPSSLALCIVPTAVGLVATWRRRRAR